MAILSKIRERSLFLILVVGLALFAFVLDPSTLSDFFSASKVNEVGEVAGESISRQDFAEALESYKGQVGNRVSEMQAAKNVWNNLVRQRIYENQLEEAGITLGEADIFNALCDNPSVNGDSRFQTTGVFDKDKLKEHLATIKNEEGNQEWPLWQNFMKTLKTNLQKSTYDNLVSSGLGASLNEGENQYLTDNTKINGSVVYIPYTTIPDTTVVVTKEDIAAYVKSHESEYQTEELRDVTYLKFKIEATEADEQEIKAKVAELIEDNGQYKGLKSSTDYKTFLNENKSDLAFNDNVQFKSQVPQVIAEDLFNGNTGDVFGPYKDGEYFKLSKITEVLEVPDSVKSSHILIPFVGGMRADASVTKTEEEAKKTADSIFQLVKNNNAKFIEVADEINTDGTKGKGGDIGWTGYSTAFSAQFDRAFADFIFDNKKGDIDVVKSKFGYHIIKVDDQKNYQKALKLATYGRKIEASEETENDIYQKAETFALDISKDKDMYLVAKKDNLTPLPALGLKVLDENVGSLGSQRSIVTWAFDKDVKVGDYKRFDLEDGYVVVKLTGKTKEGLMTVEKASGKVRPILLKEKKAALLKGKFSGATLEDIAKENKQSVKKVESVNLKSPTITGIGHEPKVVGAMLNSKDNALVKNVVGDRGVYAFIVKSKELPTALPNYDSERKRLVNQRKNQSYKIFEALKKASKVEDNVKSFYGLVGE